MENTAEMQELDMSKIDTMSETEIENIRVEKLKELNVIRKSISYIKNKKYLISLAISRLETRKLSLNNDIQKGNTIIERLNNQCEILKSKFFRKRSGF